MEMTTVTARLLLFPALVVIVALAAAGCSGGGGGTAAATPTAAPRPTPTVVVQPTVTGTATTLPDGLAYIDLQPGTGAAVSAGKTVSIDYAMYADAVRIGGTAATPLTFVLGHRQVLAGIDEGVSTMRVGGKRRLLVPAALAFGKAGLSDATGTFALVRPDQPVVVDVTLLSVK
ncbi:MAG: FKBP-type peptidyl-prolyl cis-trans isomerase [Chloroflexota bacterium]|nr:FKBP-type peptidyl-prolyl cis-trans isomerase [Chloroflexota bacterium]